jgi:hypothetical protein
MATDLVLSSQRLPVRESGGGRHSTIPLQTRRQARSLPGRRPPFGGSVTRGDATSQRYATPLSTRPATSPMECQSLGDDHSCASGTKETAFMVTTSDPSVSGQDTTQRSRGGFQGLKIVSREQVTCAMLTAKPADTRLRPGRDWTQPTLVTLYATIRSATHPRAVATDARL